jgi:transglutaminase-like putative cysteine protease
LLQIEAVKDATQTVTTERLHIPNTPDLRRISGESDIGQRIWLQAGETFVCEYDATVLVQRPVVDLNDLNRTPIIDLPGDVTPYLMASRYCHPEQFYDFVGADLGHLVGGAFIKAASDWINANFAYDSFVSHAGTTAFDSFTARRGVCRDYAHVLIAMARARAIPARIVSCYAPNVTPQDFHAVAEVYLDGAWHLVDATGMASPQDIVRIGVGRDAADVSFMTSYGLMELKNQTVQVVTN